MSQTAEGDTGASGRTRGFDETVGEEEEEEAEEEELVSLGRMAY